MLSLRLFHYPDSKPYNPPEWGTGKPRDATFDITVPRNATWRYSGLPTVQQYNLTKLKRSHVRVNDELIPRPTSILIGKDFINKPFPAEHPFHSHIPKFALLPKYDSPEDAKKGVAEQSQQPINSEMPANHSKTFVMEKAKGSPYRREFQDLPKESERKALRWPGENFFDQQSKVHGGKVQYYPVPPKSVCPNLQSRDADLRVNQRTANALRNVEREHSATSYRRDFTGTGPSNPMLLDNLQAKADRLVLTGVQNDELQPTFLSTFDPPRPREGRLSLIPSAQPAGISADFHKQSQQSNSTRKMTPAEREEHVMLHGSNYVNLPDTSYDPNRDVTWRQLDLSRHSGYCLKKLEEFKDINRAQLKPVSVTEEDQSYMDKLMNDRCHRIQEMEASNRWKDLDLQTATHHLLEMRRASEMLPSGELPHVYLRHRWLFNEQRAGLYKTCYDPHLLTSAMKFDSGSASAHLFNTLHSHEGDGAHSSLASVRLNAETDLGLDRNHSFPFHQAELSGDRAGCDEVMRNLADWTERQKQCLLPPEAHLADRSVQEGELVNAGQTTTGHSYNTAKYLQNHQLRFGARSEPLHIMSEENKLIDRVDGVPSVPPHHTTRISLPDCDVGLEAHGTRSKANVFHATEDVSAPSDVRVDRSRFRPTLHSEHHLSDRHRNLEESMRKTPSVVWPVKLRRVGLTGLLDSEYTGQFQPSPAIFPPSTDQRASPPASTPSVPTSVFGSGYHGRESAVQKDSRCGIVRPQSCCSRLQDAFVKSDVHRGFHSRFRENSPDLRSNITKGRRHQFGGFNAQLIRG